MLAFSERQYSRSGQLELTTPLKLALMQWREILSSGKPRPVAPPEQTGVEVVVFTDGYAPDARFQESGECMIGATLFSHGRAPIFVSDVVRAKVMDTWLPRKTQIAMVELFATVVALAAFPDLLCEKRVLLFVDAEAIQGALINGYSGRSDLCELVGLFWAIVRKLNCLLYIDRVPTDMNPADMPSRGRVRDCTARGWQQREFSVLSLGKGGLGVAGIQLWDLDWVFTGVCSQSPEV
jgi:hypothetical protein